MFERQKKKTFSTTFAANNITIALAHFFTHEVFRLKKGKQAKIVSWDGLLVADWAPCVSNASREEETVCSSEWVSERKSIAIKKQSEKNTKQKFLPQSSVWTKCEVFNSQQKKKCDLLFFIKSVFIVFEFVAVCTMCR